MGRIEHSLGVLLPPSLQLRVGRCEPPRQAYGFYVQTGYFLVPRKLEIAGRWSRVWGDRFPGHPRGSTDEIAGAVNYFLSGQNLKLSFDVTRLNGAPLLSEDVSFRGGGGDRSLEP
jgi:hypothetical protein